MMIGRCQEMRQQALAIWLWRIQLSSGTAELAFAPGARRFIDSAINSVTRAPAQRNVPAVERGDRFIFRSAGARKIFWRSRVL